MAAATGVSTVATGEVSYPPDRPLLQDVVTCIRDDCTTDALDA
jgi:hypothetical protein